MTHHVLFVDDEKNILSSIRRDFIDEDRYNLSFANSGNEGLEILKSKSASVIISDMRMPQMDGMEFLEKSREAAPDAVRMVLSAYADIDSILQAINQGHVWRYICKPWNSRDLVIAVKNAAEFYDKSMETKRLLDELKKKNRQLADVNNLLEERVRERTIQLKERGELLQMIVESESTDKIMKRACGMISRQIDNRKAYIVAPFLKKTFGEQEITVELKSIGEEAIATGKSQYAAQAAAIVLSKGGEYLGALVLENDEKLGPSRIVETIDSYSSIITIALFQQKAFEDMPSLLDTLEKT